MKKYLTHLPISKQLVEDLKDEFYDNLHRAKKYTASNGTITRTLEEMDVIRLDDMVDCDLAHSIANRLSHMIGTRVKPRYYRQAAHSDLNSHRDVGATVAINIILNGEGPVTFDDKYNIYYKCAMLNVQELHGVKTDDTRIMCRFTIDDMDYDEVLEMIKGKESELFDI
jgi:hypothetical protein